MANPKKPLVACSRPGINPNYEAHEILIHTDGACSGNPGPGGWGVCREFSDRREAEPLWLNGGEPHMTTNNRMELMAALNGVRMVDDLIRKHSDMPREIGSIAIYTDSQYVEKGINQWSKGWVAKGFSGVKNPDLWSLLLNEYESIRAFCPFIWEKGHDQSPGNNRADLLAREGMKRGLSSKK